jgi:hypothetical protein
MAPLKSSLMLSIRIQILRPGAPPANMPGFGCLHQSPRDGVAEGSASQCRNLGIGRSSDEGELEYRKRISVHLERVHFLFFMPEPLLDYSARM